MKTIVCLLLGTSLLSIGCKGTPKDEGPSLPPLASARPRSDAPPELQRLLPKEQLNESNARVQAKLLEETLQREGGFAQK
jgi:hypothetical protein